MTFPFSPPEKHQQTIGTTEAVLLSYTKKEKWSYRMKRVISNKTTKQNYFSARTEQLGR